MQSRSFENSLNVNDEVINHGDIEGHMKSQRVIITDSLNQPLPVQ